MSLTASAPVLVVSITALTEFSMAFGRRSHFPYKIIDDEFDVYGLSLAYSEQILNIVETIQPNAYGLHVVIEPVSTIRNWKQT